MAAPEFVAHAVTRHVRVSAQKTRLVAALIRRRAVGEALTILRYNRKAKPSAVLEKTLRSAVANAQQKNPGLDVDALRIASVLVNQGPAWKRIRPAPQGRAYRVLKRTSHVHIYLAEKTGR
ncbi:MAG: 50S ribosomal protein L22 [Candidatus Aminicenantes bacterium]|nr:50S ribosomal protein L22 [Candidatus Aminicenantes bacterium]